MIYFWRVCRYFAAFDLTIARSTGRNQEDIARLSNELAEYDLRIFVEGLK